VIDSSIISITESENNKGTKLGYKHISIYPLYEGDDSRNKDVYFSTGMFSELKYKEKDGVFDPSAVQFVPLDTKLTGVIEVDFTNWDITTQYTDMNDLQTTTVIDSEDKLVNMLKSNYKYSINFNFIPTTSDFAQSDMEYYCTTGKVEFPVTYGEEICSMWNFNNKQIIKVDEKEVDSTKVLKLNGKGVKPMFINYRDVNNND
jgi:hypothetical protein